MKKLIRTIALFAVVAMLTAAFAAFPGSAYKSYKAAANTLDAIHDGDLVYYQGFDYSNISGNDEVTALLGWRIVNIEDGALKDHTAQYSIEDGRLKINNAEGTDCYCYILDDSKMWEVVSHGRYTVQYDVQITNDASTTAKDRYIALIYNYDGKDTYNSFHVRTRGTANNQCRVVGSWSTYDVDGDYYAAGTDNGTSSSILYKLTNGQSTYAANTAALLNMNFTIKYQCDSSAAGPTVYMKNNDIENSEFVLVSKGDESSSGFSSWYNSTVMGAFALALKPSQKVDGYIDNIYVYAGLGDAPENTSTSYVASDFSQITIRNTDDDKGGISYVGAQEVVTDAGLSVRLIGGINSRKYNEVGFKLKINADGTETEKVVSDKKVYNTLNFTADGENDSFYSWDDNAPIMFANVLEGLPKTGTVTIELTPYSVNFDNVTTEADTYILTYTDGVFTSQVYK